ncbi:MAG: regulatory iron-sulfur-containing complex subunit RicT [Bacteroidales bacterium]|nr:regulatory iron-sulfur-containing complex subunit RicT [Bacteroidales bacterium]
MNDQEKGSDIGTNKAYNHRSYLSDTKYKLPTFDWLYNVPEGNISSEIIEVRFKNTRKGFYNNVNHLRLRKGDVVAVEASPGHDIGIVSLAGELVPEQLKKYNINIQRVELKKVYRKAKPVDLQKWEAAKSMEHDTMLKARELANGLNLNMKIGDVELQGDKTKAIFYYIAEERVDFRELIRVLADTFKIRIEMRQIGARQEAGRIGGIGSCGRELCCSTWMINFVSVSTSAARYQELSLNPQKLAGQCGKLKCCLNYELDCYLDAQKDFPNPEIPLELMEGTAYHQKTDIFNRLMWYSFDSKSGINTMPVPVDRVKEILEMNKKGQKPDYLVKDTSAIVAKEHSFDNVVGQESLTRFDGKSRRKKKSKRKRKHHKPKQ